MPTPGSHLLYRTLSILPVFVVISSSFQSLSLATGFLFSALSVKDHTTEYSRETVENLNFARQDPPKR